MKSRREEAMENFRKGYNCAQSVVIAHCDLLNLTTEQAARLSQSFGGGMGRLRQVCGTVSAMFMINGMLTGTGEPKQPEEKLKNYDMVQKLAAEFEAKNGSIICRELLGLDTKHSTVDEKYRNGIVPEPRSEEYYKKRPCLELIGDACDILAEKYGPLL